MNSERQIKAIYLGLPTADGDGVQLTRILGQPQLMDVDPFLLLDHFSSRQANDYIGGFPSHPHRGFETITYMLNGRMKHQDSQGQTGMITDGGVQWMRAGRGIIHSEMPEQSQGLMSGFQLWVNLPAAEKMTEPAYADFEADQIPVETWSGGVTAKIIAGTTSQGTTGPVNTEFTDMHYWDVHMPAKTRWSEQTKANQPALIYVHQGALNIGDKKVQAGELAVLTEGSSLHTETENEVRFLFLAGEPMHEPIKRAGPFVMNTSEELKQAFVDYQNGELGTPP